MRRWVLWVVISCELGASGSAYAQDTERALLTSAAVLSIHQPGESDSPYLRGPFGGTAPGVVIGIQVPRSRGFGAGFEVGLERSIQGSQEQRVSLQGTASLLTTHRDTTFSGLIA
jgi:hypothetical protein